MARTKNPHAATVKAWETRGRKQEGGGSSPVSQRSDWQKEMRQQMGTGADAHNPVFIMGAQHAPARINDYLARAGAKDWEAAPLPPNVERGEPSNCYENASQLMLFNRDLDYCEGIAYPAEGAAGGMAFLHAWAVDRKTGRVIDPTWDKPEKCRYYGVRYDRTKYLAHIMKTKMWGVLGGDDGKADKVMDRGGL